MLLWRQNIMEQVLQQHRDHRMWRNPHIVSRQARPQSYQPFVPDRLRETVQKSRVGEGSVLVLFHPHELCLDVVKG